MFFISLPMYDLEGCRSHTEAWLRVLAQSATEAGFGPILLTPDRNKEVTEPRADPDLLLTQICGYAIANESYPNLQVLGVPAFAVPGFEGHDYRSAFVVRANDARQSLADFEGGVAAYNEKGSHSGYTIFRYELSKLGLAQEGAFFSKALETGSHRASANAVARGDAELTCIDCVSFALLCKYHADEVASLRVLAWSEAAPALPYVTGLNDPDRIALLRSVLHTAFSDSRGSGARKALFLESFFVADAQLYERTRRFERAASGVRFAG